MSEILNITLSFFVFFIFLCAPLNINKSQIFKFESKHQIGVANLIINLNFLIIISLLPFKLISYLPFYFTALLLISTFNFLKKKEIFKFDKLIFSFFFVLFLIISLDIAVKLNLGWDAKWFWYIKSLFFFQNYNFGYLSQYEFNSFHPHFGSYLWAFFRELSLNKFEYSGRLFYVFLYLSSILFLIDRFKKNKIQNFIIIFLLLLLTYSYKIFSGLQEILIFSVLIVTTKLIYEYINYKKNSYLFLIILCMNIILWIKAEGIAYFMIILVGFNFIKNIDFEKRLLLLFSSLILILFKTLIYKYFQISLNDQPYFVEYILNLDLQTIIFKLKNIIIYGTFYSLKNIIFLIVPIIFLINYKILLKDEFNKIIFIMFMLNIGFIISAYMFRQMEIVYSLRTTMDRIIFTSSGLYVFYFVNFLNSKNYFKEYILQTKSFR
tara:strand:+ start:315 stop:1622 length:1308 start_codon:yes stop_codon:yes gene_type:complete